MFYFLHHQVTKNTKKTKRTQKKEKLNYKIHMDDLFYLSIFSLLIFRVVRVFRGLFLFFSASPCLPFPVSLFFVSFVSFVVKFFSLESYA